MCQNDEIAGSITDIIELSDSNNSIKPTFPNGEHICEIVYAQKTKLQLNEVKTILESS
jgi:regulator of replication initiation timing